MTQNVDTTPAQEVKEEQATVDETTIADALDDKETKVPDSIPYNRFKEKVDEVKGLTDRIEELESKLASGEMNKAEVQEDLESIADEHNLDATVLGRVAKAMEARALKSVEEKLAPLTAREEQVKRDKAFETMFNRAIEQNPEYAEVADKEVLRQLAFNPGNAQKTFSQLLNDTYGKFVTKPEKKTLETTTAGKTDAIESIDYKRAQTDSEYFAKIKADPALHAKYNEETLKGLTRIL